MTLIPLHGPLRERLIEEAVEEFRVELGSDGPECQADHGGSVLVECSVEVVAYIEHCRHPSVAGLVCQATIDDYEERKGARCGMCGGAPAADCYSYRYI